MRLSTRRLWTSVARARRRPTATSTRWPLTITEPCFHEANILGMANYFSGLDPYFLYFTCYLNEEPATSKAASSSQRDVMIRHQRRKMGLTGAEGDQRSIFGEFESDPDHTDYDPNLPQCAHHDDYSIWLQLPELRSVLHVPDDVPELHELQRRGGGRLRVHLRRHERGW
ncbi:hypothetical protein PFISCL1PPCAC_28719 [Pristionchus fissidentatus]|uniref:Uncharacterized protein n=1 Tax=Pristionchus fissidentatus TaxID=1538716 RepID=A0AAV5X4F9_9BILA|nr:hypothetical protein PFISCL1PPCAC_28719 [Pristionchus fissidentatus]